MTERPLFLTQEEVDMLTGIKKGRTEGNEKLTKYQRQVNFLRKNGICFVVNVLGRPIITRSQLEGKEIKSIPQGWQSNAR